jgi:hypothetical protein
VVFGASGCYCVVVAVLGARWLRWDEDRTEARTAAATRSLRHIDRPRCAQEFRGVEMTP